MESEINEREEKESNGCAVGNGSSHFDLTEETSRDFQRGQLFQISEIRAEIKPVMFKLIDLMKDPIPGQYYREQLTKAPAPKQSDYFFVEKILGKKKIGGKEHFLVKYLYYPDKFNQYIPKSNLTKSIRQ